MPSSDTRTTTVQFMRECMQTRISGADLSSAQALVQSNDMDWDALDELACGNFVAPLLYKIVRQKQVIPPSLEADWQIIYYANAGRTLLLRDQISEIVHALATVSITPILLKGSALAEAVYENPALRPMRDIDLLVGHDEVSRTLDALATLRYVPTQISPREKNAVQHESEIQLYRDDPASVAIEVHWSLFNSSFYRAALDIGWFWQTALPVQVGREQALMLGPEAQLLHLSAHLVLHHGGEGLLWQHDIAEVIAHYRDHINWALLLQKAQDFDLVTPLQQTLPLLADQWKAPVPREVVRQIQGLRPTLAEQRAIRLTDIGHQSVADDFWAHFAGKQSWGERTSYLGHVIFPSFAYMQQRYKIPHPIMTPLYYPYRWLQGLKSVISSLKHGRAAAHKRVV